MWLSDQPRSDAAHGPTTVKWSCALALTRGIPLRPPKGHASYGVQTNVRVFSNVEKILVDSIFFRVSNPNAYLWAEPFKTTTYIFE